MALFGCDTFIVLPPLTAQGNIIFGKNSDRPRGEVQEVVLFPSNTYNSRQTLQCTYLNIEQVSSTYSVLLSKPAWMWGAEMGANSCGLVIGNEAVWTVVEDDIHNEKLLGMDLLRLGLERASNSIEAVRVITSLLEEYGQGGPCSDIDLDLLYHNSFLIADRKEAWVLETAGKLWAAERIIDGYRNISNCLSIGSNIHMKSKQLEHFAKEKQLWTGERQFSFKEVFSAGGCPREAAGNKLLHDSTVDKQFDVKRMFQILRDKESSICRPTDDPFPTASSWVSVLPVKESMTLPCHYVTATPDPSISVFKPFVFSPSPVSSPHIISPIIENDPARMIPRFTFNVDRRHKLYELHENSMKNKAVLNDKKQLEEELFNDITTKLISLQKGTSDMNSCNKLLSIAVEKEINIMTK